MALAEIKQKILSEAQAKADAILAAAEKLAAEKLAVAQKQFKAERQKAETLLAKEREQTVQQRRQLLAMESEQKGLALKREYLQQTLQLAVEKIRQKKLKEFYLKIFRGLELHGAQIITGGETAPAEAACRALGVSPKIILKKDWPAGCLEIDYGRSRVDCSLLQYAQELTRTMEAELAERLWP